MQNKKISINKLISNAEEGVISREVYIEKIIQDMMNAPLNDFVNRGPDSTGSSDTLMDILNELKLPEKYLDAAFKDLIFVMFEYYHLEELEQGRMARNALVLLANLAINNSNHVYER